MVRVDAASAGVLLRAMEAGFALPGDAGLETGVPIGRCRPGGPRREDCPALQKASGVVEQRVLARRALLDGGWAEDVLLTIRGGEIAAVSVGAGNGTADLAAGDCYRAGIVIPGLTNAHSHAFQRALAGRTEYRATSAPDSFWTWRTQMYGLAETLDPDGLAAVARQAYTEMLENGYTAVVEFHYLFRDGDGEGPDAMFRALCRAARESGIRLIYAPVLYERAGFDRAGPEGAQRRFAMDVGAFLAHVERAAAEVGRTQLRRNDLSRDRGAQPARGRRELAGADRGTRRGRGPAPPPPHRRAAPRGGGLRCGVREAPGALAPRPVRRWGSAGASSTPPI